MPHKQKAGVRERPTDFSSFFSGVFQKSLTFWNTLLRNDHNNGKIHISTSHSAAQRTTMCENGGNARKQPQPSMRSRSPKY